MADRDERWVVKMGQRYDIISADLLKLLGFEAPYTDDETRLVNDTTTNKAPLRLLAEAYAKELDGDEAVLYAIHLKEERYAAQALMTARQKVAEIELKAAEEHRAAEGIALAAARERNKQ